MNKKMLALQSQQKYFKKLICFPNGVWAVVLFRIELRNGKFFAKAVSYEALNEKDIDVEEPILCLPCVTVGQEYSLEDFGIKSPFISWAKDFSFLVKQSPRAPSFC